MIIECILALTGHVGYLWVGPCTDFIWSHYVIWIVEVLFITRYWLSVHTNDKVFLYHSGFSVHSNVKICLTYGITIALAFIFLLERTKNNIIFLVGLKPGKKKKVQELCMQEKITTLQHCQHYLLGWIKKRITKKKRKNQTKSTKQKSPRTAYARGNSNIAILLWSYHCITKSPLNTISQLKNSDLHSQECDLCNFGLSI